MTTLVVGGVIYMFHERITNSEWLVMRVFWEESPLSSTEVSEKLHEETLWSGTTVKTFISRLVKKGLLKFQSQGRKYFYYPTINEKSCIENEMSRMIQKIYGGTLTLESEHFRFYGDNHRDFIETIANHLENNINQIFLDLQIDMKNKQSLYIYKTQSRLHSALGIQNDQSWIRAGGSWGIIHLGPECCFVNETAGNIAVHVLVEIKLYEIDPKTPAWLTRGISSYYGGWLTRDRITTSIKHSLNIINAAQFFGLDEDIQLFRARFGFELSYAFIEYIVNKYGSNILSNLIRNYYHFELVFGQSKEQVFDDWLDDLKKTYL